VQVSTKLNRSHVVTGRRALLLPTLGRTDRDRRGGVDQRITVEDSMGAVHGSRGRLEPPSEGLLSEVAIVARLCRLLFGAASPRPASLRPANLRPEFLRPAEEDRGAEGESGLIGPPFAASPPASGGAEYPAGGESEYAARGGSEHAAGGESERRDGGGSPHPASGGAEYPAGGGSEYPAGGESEQADGGEDTASRRANAPQADWSALENDYALIRTHIQNVIPGFEDYERRIEKGRTFFLPNGPRDERRFATVDGRARFTANPLEFPRIPAGRLLLQTLRSHDQYNTTIYGKDDRYRGIQGGRRVVLIHAEDITALGFAAGDIVDLVSEWPGPDGLEERRAEAFRLVPYATPRGNAAAYYPETNVLVPLESYADVSGTPTSKAVIVRLERRTS